MATPVADALHQVASLGIDTAPLVYFVEAHPLFLPVVAAVLERVAQSQLTVHASATTLTEVLIQPLRTGDLLLESTYRELLMQTPGVHCHPVTGDVAQTAARLRATYNLRTPDALQVASAMVAGCQAFLTNDTELKRVREIVVLVVSELEVGMESHDRTGD